MDTPSLFWPSLVALMLLALVHTLAGRLRMLRVLPRSRWLSLAGGVSVAYVFVHLLPELAEAQRVLAEHAEASGAGLLAAHASYLLALSGLVAFYGLERWVKCRSTRDAAVFWPHILTFAAYNFVIGYLLVRRPEPSDTANLAWYAAAMALHFVVSDFGLREQHASSYEQRGRWVLVAALLAGWATALALALPEGALVAMTALLAGGVVLNVLKEELPEERESRFGAFFAGATGYALVLLLASR